MQGDLDNLLDESIRKRTKFSSTSGTVTTLLEQEKEVGQQPGAQTDKRITVPLNQRMTGKC